MDLIEFNGSANSSNEDKKNNSVGTLFYLNGSGDPQVILTLADCTIFKLIHYSLMQI
jgi:hypothetical protein